MPFKDGGLFGVIFTPEHVFTVGDTVNLQWKVEAHVLKEPYRGADAYVTREGLLAAQVSTFDPGEAEDCVTKVKRIMHACMRSLFVFVVRLPFRGSYGRPRQDSRSVFRRRDHAHRVGKRRREEAALLARRPALPAADLADVVRHRRLVAHLRLHVSPLRRAVRQGLGREDRRAAT